MSTRPALRLVATDEPRVQPHDPRHRGLVVTYRRGETNHCPGCGLRNWTVGRRSAECGSCGLALDFAEGGR